jgi:hypothetical protein
MDGYLLGAGEANEEANEETKLEEGIAKYLRDNTDLGKRDNHCEQLVKRFVANLYSLS